MKAKGGYSVDGIVRRRKIEQKMMKAKDRERNI